MQSKEIDESGLIVKAVAGDFAALEMLFYIHGKRLLGYIQAHFPPELHGSLEPRDVLQDTWLRAIGAISDFRPIGSDALYRWLVTIARNLISRHLRNLRRSKRSRVPKIFDDTSDTSSIARLLEELALYHRTPSKSAASHEMIAALDNAIAQLPSDQANALRLRFISGVDVTEIARRMHRSPGSVSMLCNRALKSLRGKMRSASLYI